LINRLYVLRYNDLERLPAGAAERLTRPLLWVAVGLLAGQAAAATSSVLVASALAALGPVLFCLWRRWSQGALAGVALLGAVFGFAQTSRLLAPDPHAQDVHRFAGRSVELRGRIAARPSRGRDRTRLLIDVSAVRGGGDWETTQGRVLVTLRSPTKPWRRDDRIRAGIIRLRRPRNFGNPGEFDYVAHLARRGVHVTGFAMDDLRWERKAPVRRGWGTWVERWREQAAEVIDKTLVEPEASIVAAILLGESAAVDAALRQRYARAGVSHILAISGLHVGLVAAAAYAVARWLLARSEWILLRTTVPKLALAFTLPPVLLYAAIAGGSVATMRATVMAVLVVAGVLLDRRRDWLNALAAAASVVGLAWPGAVFEISFQLSFVAVLAIILGMRRVQAWEGAREEARLAGPRPAPWRLLRGLVLFQAVTLCALIGTAPLVAWHFNQVSIVGLVANTVVVPLIGTVPVSFGLLAVLVLPIAPGLAGMLLRGVGAVVHGADLLVQLFASLPGAALRVVTPSLFELALIYGILGSFVIPRRRVARTLLLACVVLLAADGAYWYGRRFHGSSLSVTFVSVGQGDSTLVEFPGGATMVVDGGGLSPTFDTGERIVAPQLWRRKIGRIDLLVLTHADFDHFGGLGFLAREFRPREFWWNGGPGRGARLADLWESVRDAEILGVARGYRRTIGGVDVRVLHPGRDSSGSDNDRSVTLQLRYGDATVLLPGDLEARGELALLDSSPGDLASTVLKAPHHGSRTSSTPRFLDAVAPRLVVVSCGHDNRFGFPHPLVLDAYERRGIEVLRTDRDGAVSVTIDANGTLTVRRFYS
jgi:competence protein ComEC